MNSVSMESQIDLQNELQKNLDRVFDGASGDRVCPYGRAAVLVLYWAEDDFNPPCEVEAKSVVDVFRREFHYSVQVFPIPMMNSRNLLEQAVVNFKCHNDGEDCLLIVYYSGHADPDEIRGKAIWAA
jgi:hypothetical protein